MLNCCIAFFVYIRTRMYDRYVHVSTNISTQRIENGDVFPINWYVNPPKGGPTDKPMPNPAKATRMAFARFFSSVNLSAKAVIPVRKYSRMKRMRPSASKFVRLPTPHCSLHTPHSTVHTPQSTPLLAYYIVSRNKER